jgi:hypothetical protein
VNPLASHWLRLGFFLLLSSPVVALLLAITTGVEFWVALALTLYTWAMVCVILALIATAGLVVRLLGWGIRALRR